MIRWIQKAVEPVSYEEHRQVLEERDSLKDQLSQANRKIGGLENYRAFDVQELQKYLDNQVTHGKKEIQRLEGLLGIKISPKDQHSVGEEVIKHFEHYIESKDKIIRVLENELAMKDEEMRRRLKSQVDIREEEYARLRNIIQSASTNLDSAVTTLDNAFKSRIKNPPEEGIKYMFTEKDLIGAWPSEEVARQLVFQVVEDHNEVSAERNSLQDQKPVGEREVNGFEYQIRSKDEDIRRLEHEHELAMKEIRLLEHELAMKDTRRLEHELAMKDEEMRRLKSQLDVVEKEFVSLRIAIWSACNDLSSAVVTADDALDQFKDKSPSKNGIEHFFTEKDLYGAVSSAQGAYPG